MSDNTLDPSEQLSDRLLQASVPKEIEYGDYVMGFFDLLGQQHALQQLDPTNEDATVGIEEPIVDAFGKVMRFRQVIRNSFKKYPDPDDPEVVPPDLTKEQLKQLEQLRGQSLVLQGFSDTIIASANVRTQADLVYVGSSYSLLTAAASTMLLALAQGIVPRGAMDIGFAIRCNDEVYGPVLSSCYQLESSVASWPRIVLGQGLLDFLDLYRSLDCDTPIGRLNSGFSTFLQRFVFEDADGQIALDYLKMAKTFSAEIPEFHLLVGSARLALEEGLTRTDGIPRVPEKYRRALQYFQEREGEFTEVQREQARAFRAKVEVATD